MTKPKAIDNNTGRRPYLEYNEDEDFVDFMRTSPLSATEDFSSLPHSEMHKPYLDERGYQEMEAMHPDAARLPYTDAPPSPDVEVPGDTPDPCANHTADLFIPGMGNQVWYDIWCGETIFFAMMDGTGLTYCMPLMLDDDVLNSMGTDRDKPGQISLKIPCRCDDYQIYMICHDTCDSFSAVVINVKVPDATVYISGNTTPSGTGGTYTAVGGLAPYEWSVSCGTVTTGGEDTASASWDWTGCCGMATITVTSSCGTTASLEVRMPGAASGWVLVETCTATCLHFGCGYSAGTTVTETTATKWTVVNCGCYDVAGETNCSVALGVPGYVNTCPADCGPYNIYATSGEGNKYEWQCL
ncbi:hypothetical protein [Candidatus Magnetobacterium casense]|uniref:Uncharacterized protein n=1 Tax=Candidatus Magnetobacterium casense TaxID=1455061 RepID=A0ABS6RUZ5_9BACT|nr:hypothetical protein [Candidatus Magnetobacterium casensis]MBV6340446.1 hypothetical protein [Candidatus Magnetobacterium casensis]